MSYEVWFGKDGKWFGYHSFKYRMEAVDCELKYLKIFKDLTVEIRSREHAYQ